MGKLIVISAPSGAGKTTIANRLLQDSRFARVITHTARPPREGEVDGVDYNFVSYEYFEEMIKEDKFVEHALVHGNLYGTAKTSINLAESGGKHVLLIVDWQGATRIKERYPDSISIFVLPPSLRVLESRLRKRVTDSEEVIKQRLNVARDEITHIVDFDHFVVNNDLNAVTVRIFNIVDVVTSKRTVVNVSDLTRGLFVSWEWADGLSGTLATTKGIRPIGRVVTREDLPHMHTDDSGFGVQTLDDAEWVINPTIFTEKGRILYLADSGDCESS